MSELSTEAIMRLLAQRVPDIARRAVPVPSMRLATVALTSDPTATYVRVQVDGDSAPVDVLNGCGATLGQGQRVAVQFYPPHGALVVGLLTPLLALEQAWTTTYDVTSGTVGGTASTAWTLLTGDGLGWDDSGGDLVCEVAGQWAIDLEAVWASSGAGTHRAVELLDAAAVGWAAVSHQFTAPGGTPTSGYGLSGAGIDIGDFLAGDTLAGQARQDTGGDLQVRLVARLRLLGPSA